MRSPHVCQWTAVCVLAWVPALLAAQERQSARELGIVVGVVGTGPLNAVIEETEEAIYNSLFLATTVDGHRGRAEALPIPETVEILQR